MDDSCPFCGKIPQIRGVGTRDLYDVTCPRCGSYRITHRAQVNARNLNVSDRVRSNISGFLRENQPLEIDEKMLDRLESLPNPRFHDRADKLLIALEKMTEYAGQEVLMESVEDDLLSYGWCINNDELYEIIDFLSDSKRITQGVGNIKIIPDGWLHLEKLLSRGHENQQGFVAMWFDDSMSIIYNDAISLAILDSGYKPHRVDQREHNGKIDDEIISQIRRSRFIIADFTGHRGGVYYEAGFAMGLNLEVIWTCRHDELDKLHFDIRQYNCISWEMKKLEEFRKKLHYRIERVLGRGTYKSR